MSHQLRPLMAIILLVFGFLYGRVVNAAEMITISEGTEVRLRLLEKLSSSSATEGQRFNLELDDDLRVNGVVIVPRGAKALGTVIHAKKRGFMGKGGELNIMIDYVLLNDQRIRLRASSGNEGADRVGSTVVLTVLFGPLGLLKRGKDIEINPGVVFPAFVDQTTQVSVGE